MGAAALKVLCLVPSLRQGGAEMQAVNLANGLDPARFEAHLLYYDGGEALRDRVNTSRVRLHRLQKKRAFDFALASAVARIIDSEGIEVVHCTIQYSMLLGAAARLLARRKPPLVAAIHTTVNLTGYYELADRLLYRGLLKRCAATVFVCETQREHWIAKYPELRARSQVVYNGVDTDFFDPAQPIDSDSFRARFEVPLDGPMISCVAGFRPEKAHDLLLRAFAAVLESQPKAYLVLAGGGPTRESTEKLAQDLGVASNVRFAGPIADVRTLLAASDVTVLASTAVETFSMAMLESMAMGVPLVATDMGGTREAVLDGRTGLLVPPGDVPALARGLGRLAGDADYRRSLGRNARQLVLERFTERGMIRETERLLHDIARRA